MIIINGYKFAEKESEIIDSLFEAGGTVAGKAKKSKRKIMFYDLQDNPVGVISQSGVIGKAKKLDSGKVWFSYGNPFFVESLSTNEQHSLSEQFAIDSDSKGYIFK